MIELVYMSQAKHIFKESELDKLLALARRNNEERGITGLLLYDGVGTFLQALEGEEEAVNALFGAITKDDRHTSVQKLLTSKIDQRCFPDWKMGFYRVSKEELSPQDGYTSFLQDDGKLEAKRTDNNAFLFEVINRFKRNAASFNRQ